jgi:hypothetical protein
MKPFHGSSKPYVRWWWLSGPFTKADISAQLEWVQAQGFGGVELAWIRPDWLDEQGADAVRPALLSPDWSELVSYTKRRADELSLGCDFTFGSSWPFGGPWVAEETAARTFDGISTQEAHSTWETEQPGPARVVDHLSEGSLRAYAKPLLEALQTALEGSPSALFCDSLELRTERMWSEQLWAAFEERFGYSLRPYVDTLEAHADVRYDYRKLIAETMVREFFQGFTQICHENNAYSRVQCHGAPTDLLAAYASVDVPESEALLFHPRFSRIAASAAAWAGKGIVSAESFTCMYGFPGWDDAAEEYWKEEKPGDLKLLADALFANGVNEIIWHGMPYQPAGKEIEFYASVHVGPESGFVSHIPALNHYFEAVSAAMQRGRTYAQLGVYLPFEDALMQDRLPEERRTPGANFYWEMRDARPPAEAEGYQPIWISLPFLREAFVVDSRVVSRQLRLPALFVDCEWLDAEALDELLRLADCGAHIIWKGLCKQPGKRLDHGYSEKQERVARARNTCSDLSQSAPLLEGDDLPPCWVRQHEGGELTIFFAHPLAKEITYPMPRGFSDAAKDEVRTVVLRWQGKEIPLSLRFERGCSLTVCVGREETIEISQNNAQVLRDM